MLGKGQGRDWSESNCESVGEDPSVLEHENDPRDDSGIYSMMVLYIPLLMSAPANGVSTRFRTSLRGLGLTTERAGLAPTSRFFSELLTF